MGDDTAAPLTVTSWNQLQERYLKYSNPARPPRWIFRGDDRARLQPTLERALGRFDIGLCRMKEYEENTLREFKRHYHRYSQYTPAKDSLVEWLSIMQHHGAPTRLLDWTYSFHVALFFATARAEKDSTRYIWAINRDLLWRAVWNENPCTEERMKPPNDKDPAVQFDLLDSRSTLVCPMNPMQLNERLSVQQGLFLAPLHLEKPFNECFDASVKKIDELNGGTPAWERIDIKCSAELMVDILKELQSMNITGVSLKPGLDGFAESLANRLPLDHLWPPT